MRLQLATCFAALALVACSKSETDADTGPAGKVAEKRMPLVDCATAETVDAGADGWKHPDCRMRLNDSSELAIEARYAPAEDDSTRVSIQIVAPGDATLQTIEEIMGNTFNAIAQRDVDADGKADLLLPLETGNVNTTWAIWRQEEAGKFQRAGEVSGVGIDRTADGYFAVPARSSADAWEVAFLRLDGGVLVPVAIAEVTAHLSDKGEPDPAKVECAVRYDSQTAGIGLSLDEARTKFCAEPEVVKIFS